jgi:transposase-like protein
MDHANSQSDIDERARTSSRRTARNAHVEIITRGARRRWSIELKREIVAKSLGLDLTPSEVMRKYGIGSGQLYTWRRELLSLQTAMVAAPARFTEVEFSVPSEHRAEVEAGPIETPPSPPSPALARAGGADRDRDAERLGVAGRRADRWARPAPDYCGAERTVIALASGLRVFLACGVTDMRKGMVGLAMIVQQTLAEDPFGGAVFAFRGRRAGLIKLIWHDGVGLCMLTKYLVSP